MDKTQILEIIEEGETQKVEFKQSFHSSQNFSKLMCGFANTSGGIILIGINPEGGIKGIKDNVDVIQQRISAAAQAISPSILPMIHVIKIKNHKIISIVIQKAIDGIFHSFQGVIYVKVGSTLKKIEGTQIIHFLRSKQVLSFDETYCNIKIKDLDVAKIKYYLKKRKQEDYLTRNSMENFLLNMKLAKRNGDLKIKNATALFFAKEPINFFPQIEVKLVLFEGIEPVKIIAHQLIQSDPLETINRAIAFVKKHTSRSIEIEESPQRKEIYEFPMDVVREAIINAVAHRDYFSMDAIQIYIFDNRIEITNPGSLPNGLTKELFGTLSIRRNPITYRLLRDLGYIEGLGSGIPRMIDTMRENGLKDPEFGIFEYFFRVILYNKPSKERLIKQDRRLNERQKKALMFLVKYKKIKMKEYQKINNTSYGTANKEIRELLKYGYIKKIGQYRDVYYILIG